MELDLKNYLEYILQFIWQLKKENTLERRPRTSTRSKEDLISLGEDFVEWATEETDEPRLRYCQFYSLKHGILKKEWDLILQKPEFREYYEKVQAALATKWITGDVNPSIAHRFLRIYCPDVKEDEDEKIKLQDMVPPRADLIDKENKIMELEARLAKYESNNQP